MVQVGHLPTLILVVLLGLLSPMALIGRRGDVDNLTPGAKDSQNGSTS